MTKTDYPRGMYTIKIGSLSSKRFGDALQKIKACGYSDGPRPAYDEISKTWTVELVADDRDNARTLVEMYNCTITPASTDQVDVAALISERAELRKRLAELDKLIAREESK